METAMNIQMATQATTGQNENNSKMEAAIMTVKNIIQNKTQILAGLVVGGMMAVAFMLPGNASADNSARPLGQVESSAFIPASATANVIDMDIIDPGFYDAKLISNNKAHGFDMDLLDPGIYDAKLVSTSSVWESDGVDPYENVALKSVIKNTGSSFDMDLLDPGFYDAKLISANTGSSFDMDLLDPGFYDAKLARTSTVWESDGVDPYENVVLKSVRTGSAMDMDLLDPGIYDAKLAPTSNGIEGLQEDNII